MQLDTEKIISEINTKGCSSESLGVYLQLLSIVQKENGIQLLSSLYGGTDIVKSYANQLSSMYKFLGRDVLNRSLEQLSQNGAINLHNTILTEKDFLLDIANTTTETKERIPQVFIYKSLDGSKFIVSFSINIDARYRAIKYSTGIDGNVTMRWKSKDARKIVKTTNDAFSEYIDKDGFIPMEHYRAVCLVIEGNLLNK